MAMCQCRSVAVCQCGNVPLCHCGIVPQAHARRVAAGGFARKSGATGSYSSPRHTPKIATPQLRGDQVEVIGDVKAFLQDSGRIMIWQTSFFDVHGPDLSPKAQSPHGEDNEVGTRNR